MKKLLGAALLVSAATLGVSCDSHRTKADLKNEVDTLSYELGMANSPSEEELRMYLADARTGSDSIYVDEFLEGLKDAVQASGDKKKAAYIAGLSAGMNLQMRNMQIERYIFGNDSTKHLNIKSFYSGFQDGMSGKRTRLKIDDELIDRTKAERDANTRIEKMRRETLERENAEAIKAAREYMAKMEKDTAYKKLDGGVLYKVINPGTGNTPQVNDIINLEYEGRLTGGKVFDASSQHPGPDGKSIPFTVGNAIPGFNTALLNMPEGAEWEIIIPFDKAYNDQSNTEIPAFSNLIFHLKFVSFYKGE